MTDGVESTTAPPDPFLAEILGQPAALRRTAAGLAEQAAAVAEATRALSRGGDGAGAIILTGMGSSLDAASAAATVLCRAGRRAVEIDASELLHARRAALRPEDVLVFVSQSGRSAELVRLAETVGAPESRAARPTIIAITNGRDNPVAGRADIAIATGAGEEVGPSTGTFAATLAALAAVILGVDAAVRSTAAAARAAEAVLAQRDAIGPRLRAWLGDRPGLIAVGRGGGRAAASMGCLVLKEAARIHAEALGSAAFRHGPLELAGPTLAVAVLAEEPATLGLEVALAGELAATGSSVLWIGPAGTAPTGTQAVEVDRVDPPLGPAVAVIPLQLLAWQLAVERGVVPGTFQRATKVTERE